MADYFVDQGAYASALGAVPTWGEPQEGDGTTTSASTAAAVAAISFASAPASGTISVCGVTVSTTGVIGAASTDAAANALAANINATTTAVAVGVAFGVPQLRNLVFARGPAGGAPAGTCQIMMRVGSATLNQASNTNVGIASTFSAAPTITQFAGGVGGCWGWLINPAALGVASSIAAGAYGLAVSKPLVWSAPLTATDYVYVRTAAGKTVTLPTGTHFVRGAVGFPINLLFDTNTKWSGDSGNGVFTVNMAGSSSNFLYFRPENSNAGSLNAVSHACLKSGNFEIGISVAANGCTAQLFDNTYAYTALGVRFFETAAPGAGSRVFLQWGTNQTVRAVACEFAFQFPRTNLANGPALTLASGGTGLFELDDCDILTSLTGVPADVVPFVPAPAIAAASFGLELRLVGNRFSTGGAAKVKLFSSVTSRVLNFIHVYAAGNSGLALDSAALGFQAAADPRSSPRNNSLVFIGEGPGRHQRHEHANGIAEWNPGASPAYPTLAAQQPDGTAYAIRMYWLATGANTAYAPFSYRSALLNRLADGVRTVVQNLFMDASAGIDSRTLGVVVSYTDTSGVARSERSLFRQAPAASGATWSGAASYPSFAAFAVTLVTSYAVKTNTEIRVDVVLAGPPPGGSNTDVYVDPEPAIT